RDGGCWAQKSTLEKSLIVACGLISAVAVGLLIGLIVVGSKNKSKSGGSSTTQHPHPTKTTPVNPNVCKTTECHLAAKELREAMDTKVNPCDDFYEYACGTWMKNHKPGADQESVSSFTHLADSLTGKVIKIMEDVNSSSDVVKSMKDYYASCMDLDHLEKLGVEPLATLVESLGGWPVLQNENEPEPNVTINELLVRLSERQLNLLIAVSVQPDVTVTSKNTIYLDQPSDFGVGTLDLINITESNKTIAAYKEFIKSSVMLLSPNASLVNETDLNEDIDDLVDLEAAIAETVTPGKFRHNATKLNIRMKLGDLKKELKTLTEIDVLDLVSKTVTKTPITKDTDVIVPGLPYLKKLSEVFRNFSSETVRNYLVWRLVQDQGKLTNKAFRNISFEFAKVTTGLQKQVPRNETCSQMVTHVLNFAAASEYAKMYFPHHLREEIMDTVNNIQSGFEKNLENLKWMDTETKKQANKKASNIAMHVGYPDWILDNARLYSYYKQLIEKIQNNTLFYNFNDGKEFLRNWELQRLPLHNHRKTWIDPRIRPLDVNAMYMPTDNSIHIMAGILDTPYYKAGRPSYMNYGGIGMVAGHELTHGFDDSGRQYNAFGELVNWWSQETLEKFENKTECLIHEYSDFIEPATKLHLDGKNTIGENIADNGGIKEALTAYRLYQVTHGEEQKLPGFEKFTSTQMLFLAHANGWCANY
ncbi:MME (predicted), partial [Pycnogonum litorale]